MGLDCHLNEIEMRLMNIKQWNIVLGIILVGVILFSAGVRYEKDVAVSFLLSLVGVAILFFVTIFFGDLLKTEKHSIP